MSFKNDQKILDKKEKDIKESILLKNEEIISLNVSESTNEQFKEREVQLNVDPNNCTKIRNINKYLLYGNRFDNLNPKYLGKTRAFLFIGDYPLIIIGPDCKF